MKFFESMLCPVQDKGSLTLLLVFWTNSIVQWKIKIAQLIGLTLVVLRDSGIVLDTGSQKLVGKMAIFNSEDTELPTH